MAWEHPLEKMFALEAPSILDVIQRNNRLLMAVKGGIAQEHLRQYLLVLRDSREITDFGLLIEEGRPDFWVLWEGRNYFVECKNVQRTLRRGEIADGSITRCHWESQRYTSAIGAPSWFQHSAWCRNGDIFSEIRRGCPAGAYSTGPFSREARGIGRLG